MSQTGSHTSGWQLGADAPLAYDTYIVDTFMRGYSRRLVEVAAVESGNRVLDVACGTGVVTRLAANEAGPEGTVVGFDLNAGMLARARASTENAATIDWREGSVTEMPFEDASFDRILCQHGLQFFPDKPAALTAMHRVLAPGGRLLVSVWRSIEHCPWQSAIADAIERHVGKAQAALVRSAFGFGDAEQLRQNVVDAGFRDVEIRVEGETIRHASLEEYVPGYISATPVAGAVAGLDAAVQNEIVADVRDALGAYRAGDGLARQSRRTWQSDIAEPVRRPGALLTLNVRNWLGSEVRAASDRVRFPPGSRHSVSRLLLSLFGLTLRKLTKQIPRIGG
jgi:ubiquinone/menaquinone biosynthesis C-methylase UbiE